MLFAQKITFFETNCQKYEFDFASFCMQSQLGVRIRIRDHFSTHFDVKNPMAVQDLKNEFPLKIVFFEVIPIVSICMKF